MPQGKLHILLSLSPLPRCLSSFLSCSIRSLACISLRSTPSQCVSTPCPSLPLSIYVCLSRSACQLLAHSTQAPCSLTVFLLLPSIIQAAFLLAYSVWGRTPLRGTDSKRESLNISHGTVCAHTGVCLWKVLCMCKDGEMDWSLGCKYIICVVAHCGPSVCRDASAAVRNVCLLGLRSLEKNAPISCYKCLFMCIRVCLSESDTV